MTSKHDRNYWKWIAVLSLGLLVFTQIFDVHFRLKPPFAYLKDARASVTPWESDSLLAEAVRPSDGMTLPVRWDDLGKQMVEAGVIDADKFESLYAGRGGLGDEQELLSGAGNGNLTINAQNSGVVLNLLWAFGLANKNAILDEGPMQDPRYGGPGRFASTGGWTLARGNAMEHYSKHAFVTLTQGQQELVERVSREIYRPCCGNSTYFPDCNHGMAMLGLLELMASQGASEEEMYRVALQVNSYWFPDAYLTVAKYLRERGEDWNDMNPRTVLGSAYSSASGYKQVLTEVEQTQSRDAVGCGV